MRKKLAVAALTAALAGVPATASFADETVTPQVLAQDTEENADGDDSDKTGLWGLLGLLGLAGLVKRRDRDDVDVPARG